MEEAECIQPQYNIRRLEKQEIVKSFDCGDADLNDFILMSLYFIAKNF